MDEALPALSPETGMSPAGPFTVECHFARAAVEAGDEFHRAGGENDRGRADLFTPLDRFLRTDTERISDAVTAVHEFSFTPDFAGFKRHLGDGRAALFIERLRAAVIDVRPVVKRLHGEGNHLHGSPLPARKGAAPRFLKLFDERPTKVIQD